MIQQRAAIAMGANLGDRQATLEAAIDLIEDQIGRLVARSAWLETPAMIHPDDPASHHPAYLNGVALITTALAPAQILERLHGIERSLGRDRSLETRRWQPRVLDLDLLLVDDRTEDGAPLRLPHPGMQSRRFVLAPLAQVWPDWRHPRLGRTVQEMLDALPAEDGL